MNEKVDLLPWQLLIVGMVGIAAILAAAYGMTSAKLKVLQREGCYRGVAEYSAEGEWQWK